MNYERMINVSRALTFRKSIPAGESGFVDAPITAHGNITDVKIRFSAGENGTLHVRPVQIIPQEIMIDLLDYAGDKYVSGDDETFHAQVKWETENHAIARVYYDNVGVGTSFLNVDITVEYYELVEPANIIG